MSSIVEKTFSQLKKFTEEKGELVLYLRQSHPEAAKAALKSEIDELFGLLENPTRYRQGDIKFSGVNLLGDGDSVPIVEYTFSVKDSRFNLTELDKLLKKYGKNFVYDGRVVNIPRYENGEKIGIVKILAGTSLIYMVSRPVLENLLLLAKEVESIVQEVYGKNIENKEENKK